MNDDDTTEQTSIDGRDSAVHDAEQQPDDALVLRGRRRLLRLGVYVTPTILSMTALTSTANAQAGVATSVAAPVRVLSRIAAATRARARTRARTGGATTRARVAGTTTSRGRGSR